GRFDRQVTVSRPDIKGREQIFAVHMRGKPISNQVEVNILAKATPGFSGADIENMVNEAALLAARYGRPNIAMPEFHEAIERVQLGPERRSRVMTQSDKEITAWHEAGHALVAHLLPDAHPVRKVTIVPRGPAGGVTWFLEDDNQYMNTKRHHAMIATALGGRVAEEIVFGDVTTGASSDLQRVTKIAKAMVTQFGMSDDLGLRTYGERQEMVFLGREISEQRDYSDAIAEQIDQEIRGIVDRGHQLATQLLTDNRKTLDLIAQTLLEVESLDMQQFADLVETGKID
ncbi:MAG TPA: cell division protein FtsH, partial [Anaerolineae bacterium]|nr:cell division protein FtsH [Anaerolineae bacterium]